METIVAKSINPATAVQPAASRSMSPARIERRAPLRVQTSLQVSSPKDTAEKEAEITAKKITGMALPESAIGHLGMGEHGVFRQIKAKEKEKKLQRRIKGPYLTRFAASGIFAQKREEKTPRLFRKAEGPRNATSHVVADIQGSLGAGASLPLSVRRFMEPRFRADFSKVRIHTGASAAKMNRQLNAQAFAVGNNVFFGKDRFQPETPDGRELIAHELTHTIQQGAAVQSAEEPSVTVRSPTLVQRLGQSDALDYFAERANNIPGFRIFTIILGVNPINRNRVERSAANILRALIEIIPGGALITQALNNYGIFDRIGAWVEQQINSLALSGSAIRQAINRFLDSLSWRDIFNLAGVWDRARRIFIEPIDRLVNFGRGLVAGIVRFVKEAILRPLARLASQTRGWDLLKAVLGQDPITGDPSPRNAETLIGGFMRLISQEEVWNNLRRANAVARAWTWFQGALSGLLSFVREIPDLLVQAIQSLELTDIILLPRAFARVGRVFAHFFGRFVSWAGQQVLSLLEIIFDALAPAAMPYLRRAASAFRAMIRDPIGFIGNLVRAGIQGFRQFGAHFLTHLRTSMIQWLTGTLSGTDIYIPQAFTVREIIKFVLSVLGLTWQNIRQKLVRVIGEPAAAALETTFDIVMTLVREGPAAAWEKIHEAISNLREMVMGQIMTFVRERIVQAAITRLVTSLNPAGAFIQAVIAIYNTIMFFVERLRQIAQVAAAFIDSLSAIASGVITTAANRVEQTMAGLLTLVISFMARLVGLGNISEAVTNIVNRIRAPIDRALDRVVEWIVAQARRLGRFIAQTGVPQDPNERLRLGLTAAAAAVTRLPGHRVSSTLVGPLLPAIRLRYGLATLEAGIRGGTWWLDGSVNPRSSLNSRKAATAGESDADQVKAAVAAEAQRLPRVMESPEELMTALRNIFARHEARGLKRLFIRPAGDGLDILAEASVAAFTEHLTGLTTDGAGGCSILIQIDGRVITTSESVGLVIWNAGRGGPHAEARLYANLPMLRSHLRRSSRLIEIWIRYSPCHDRCRFVLDSIEREIHRTHQLVRFCWYYEALWRRNQTRAAALGVIREYRKQGIVITRRVSALEREELRSQRR